MSTKEEAMRWFNQGERDLGAAMVLMEKKFNESACFHSQQASEKALKSLPILKGYRTVITHSTRELYKEDADKCIKYAESILSELKNFLAK